MSDEKVIVCGSDNICVSDIKKVNLTVVSYHQLLRLEELYNGPFSSSDYIYYKRSYASVIILPKELLCKIKDILTRYWKEIAYSLPRPHKEFAYDEKSRFDVIENIYDKDIDKKIVWTYKYFVEDPYRRAISGEKELSLKKDLMPAFRKIINQKNISKKEKQKVDRLELLDLGLTLLGMHSLSTNTYYVEMSPETKKEVKSIYTQLNEYFDEAENRKEVIEKRDQRKRQHDDFIFLYADHHILTIKTIDKEYLYLEKYCGFDIFKKKCEIEQKMIELEQSKAEEDVSEQSNKKGRDELYIPSFDEVDESEDYIEDQIDIESHPQEVYCDSDTIDISTIFSAEVVLAFMCKKALFQKYNFSNREEFISKCENKVALLIRLNNDSCLVYLENECSFNVYSKKREIDIKLDKYKAKQEKIKSNYNVGEKNVDYVLKWFVASNKDKHIIAITGDCESKYRYDCILLRNSEFIDESQEFDHILVTPAGIIIVETKDWKGTIDVNADGKWVRYKDDDGSPYGVSSPIIQMRRHEQLMKSIFPNVPIHSILCFSNSSAIINGKDNISECKVINIEQLEDVLNSICKKKKYSEQEIDNIVDTIESYKINRR